MSKPVPGNAMQWLCITAASLFIAVLNTALAEVPDSRQSLSQLTEDTRQALVQTRQRMTQIRQVGRSAASQPQHLIELAEQADQPLVNIDQSLETLLTGDTDNGNPTARQPGISRAQANIIRDLRCRLAMTRADLWLCAGQNIPALTPERDAAFRRALDIYRAARLEYHNQSLSLLGYFGEARILREQQLYPQAQELLQTTASLISRTEGPSAVLFQRTLELEKLELSLATDPQQTLTDIDSVSQLPHMVDQPQWQARLNWIRARALAALAMIDKTKPEMATDAAAWLRDPSVIEVAPNDDRLELLVDLANATDAVTLTNPEGLAWAHFRFAGQHPDAVDYFDRFITSSNEQLSQNDLLTYAVALENSKRYKDAADVCDRLLKWNNLEQPAAAKAMLIRVTSLQQWLDNINDVELQATITTRLQNARQAIFASDLSQAQRISYLQQWAASTIDSNPNKVLTFFEQYPELVESDAYLLLIRARLTWDNAVKQYNSRKTTVNDDLFESALQDITDAGKLAAESSQQLLAKQIVLTHASWSGYPAVNNPERGLQLLQDNWDILSTDPQTAESAYQIRLYLLSNLGRIDQATSLIENTPRSISFPPQSCLHIAQQLADRYPSAGADFRDTLQQQVIILCQRAVDNVSYPSADRATFSINAAEILMKVNALADAERILEISIKAPWFNSNPDMLFKANLLLGQVHLNAHRPGKALEIFKQLEESNTGKPELQLAVGQGLRQLGQNNQAADAFRTGRKFATPGTELWCALTIELAEVLIDQNHDQAAEDIMRVSLALYPAFGNDQLRNRLIRLQNSTKDVK